MSELSTEERLAALQARRRNRPAANRLAPIRQAPPAPGAPRPAPRRAAPIPAATCHHPPPSHRGEQPSFEWAEAHRAFDHQVDRFFPDLFGPADRTIEVAAPVDHTIEVPAPAVPAPADHTIGVPAPVDHTIEVREVMKPTTVVLSSAPSTDYRMPEEVVARHRVGVPKSADIPWDKVSAAGASVISFASMIVAMGPMFKGDATAITTVADGGTAVAGSELATPAVPGAPAVAVQLAPIVPGAVPFDAAVAIDPGGLDPAAPTAQSQATTASTAAAATQTPATAPPSTAAPATQAPATQAPSSALAATQTTTTAAPTTAAPTTAPPATQTTTTAPPRSQGSG